MAETCNRLIRFIKHVNSLGGVRKLDLMYEIAICDCLNRLGDGTKAESLGFDEQLQETWSGLRAIITHHHKKLDLPKVWAGLPGETQALLEIINEKLK